MRTTTAPPSRACFPTHRPALGRRPFDVQNRALVDGTASAGDGGWHVPQLVPAIFARASRFCGPRKKKAAPPASPTDKNAESAMPKMDDVPSELLEDEKPVKELLKVVTKAVRDIEAITLLKYNFIVQMQRVQRMTVLEQKLQVNIKDGHKEIALLAQIASEIGKIEMGNPASKGVVSNKDTVAGNTDSAAASKKENETAAAPKIPRADEIREKVFEEFNFAPKGKHAKKLAEDGKTLENTH